MTTSGTLTFRPSDRHWILRIGARYLDIAPPTEADGEDPLATLRALADSVRPVAAAWGFGDCSISVIERPWIDDATSHAAAIREVVDPDGVVVGNIAIKDGIATISVARRPAEPWAGPRCDLLKPLKLLLLASSQIPCHGCNQSRAKCDGLPRADGDPRP